MFITVCSFSLAFTLVSALIQSSDVDVLVHGLLDGQRHVQRVLLLLRRKILRHVDLAQRLAQLAIDAAGAALPALLLLLRAVQSVRVEIPGLLIEALRHAGARIGVQQVPAQVSPDLVDRRVGHQRVELGKKLRLRIVRLAGGGRVRRGHIISQRKVRQLLFESRPRPWDGSGSADRAARSW